MDGPLRVGLTAAVPELNVARAAAQRQDWDAVAAAIAGAPSGLSQDLLISALVEVPRVEEFLGGVRAQRSEDPLAAILLSGRQTFLGWEVRTGARAQDVSAAQFATFRAYLCAAERLLIEVLARDPHQTTAWVMRVRNARGLEVGQAEAVRRYERLHALDPVRPSGQTNLLQKLLPKWGGDLAAAREFAVSCAQQHPVSAAVLADYYYEHWATLDDGENQEYLRSVRTELVAAFDGIPTTPPTDPGERYWWLVALATYAWLLPDADEHERTAQAFRLLDGAVVGVWEHRSDSTGTYKHYRDDAWKRVTQ